MTKILYIPTGEYIRNLINTKSINNSYYNTFIYEGSFQQIEDCVDTLCSMSLCEWGFFEWRQVNNIVSLPILRSELEIIDD